MAAKTESLWKFGGLTPINLVKQVWAEMNEDDVFGRSAELSYYFLLALFPMLLFLISTLAFFADPGSELRNALFAYVGKAMPPSAADIVTKAVHEANQAAGRGKVIFGILAALWAASNGLGAITKTLNIAYDVKETRPLWKKRAIAVGLTLALSILVISALTLVLFGGRIGGYIANLAGLGHAFGVTWKLLQGPVVLLFLLFAFGLIYYFAPNLKNPKWTWISPGAVVGVVLWLASSMLFRLYLQYFNSYSKTYGSLGAVIILMLWFYLTGLSILIGGEFNSVINNAAQERDRHEAALLKMEQPRAA
jgi:membrane protein